MIFRVFLASLLCAFLTSCSLSREYPDFRYYSIELGSSKKLALPTSASLPSLQVLDLQISRSYEGQELVYKRSGNELESDYYNKFFINPAAMFTDELRSALSRSGLFAQVVSPGSMIDVEYRLQGVIRSLYGDYSNPEQAHAVLELQFYLTKMLAGTSPVHFDLHLNIREPIVSQSPAAPEAASLLIAAYARGFETAVESIVVKFQSIP